MPLLSNRYTSETVRKRNSEFNDLVGVNRYMRHDGRIYKLVMAEASTVRHCYNALGMHLTKNDCIMFDFMQKAVLTSCVPRHKLPIPYQTRRRRRSPKRVRFHQLLLFYHRIRRDKWGIPLVISLSADSNPECR
ncbi:hypothetical protein EV363DRAFT_446800 [Boletus edulis]|nr:hypothetical protein EV363DRAFT_446800 [Boletus edulis]